MQPGGGNTSIKLGDALLVKGSGTDLRSIGREGFTQLSLERLAPLRSAEAMSDDDMMRFMASCMLGRTVPRRAWRRRCTRCCRTASLPTPTMSRR